jgi:hypothetical protein
MMPFPGKRRPRTTEADLDHHYELDLYPHERAVLLKLLTDSEELGEKLRAHLIQKLDLAKRQPGAPLPPVGLDWADIEEEARRQGCSEADVFFDLTGRFPN